MPTKLRALLKSLSNCEVGEKRYVQPPLTAPPNETILIQKCSVVFSYWTTTLDLIESMLKSESITFTRIDGEMSGKQRTEALERFQRDGNIQVILVSTTSGGTGYA